MKDDVFMTADRVPGHFIPGYLEYSGNPIVTKDSRDAKVCHRWEVREIREGFRLNDVTFTKSRGQLAWHEVMRQERQTYESKLGAIEAVKVEERSYLELDRQHRVELARDFRQAVELLRAGMLQETTCDWCGVDVQTINDHKTVDGQPMCLPCVSQYSLEEGRDYER
jgi:hypothetical protein